MTTLAPPLATTPSHDLDVALTELAAEFAGYRDTTAMHREIVGTIAGGLLGAGGVLHAALYACSLNSGDELYRLLDQLDTADHAVLATGRGEAPYEHDWPCAAGICPDCQEIAMNLRDEALTAIKTLLGPWVLADLAAVHADDVEPDCERCGDGRLNGCPDCDPADPEVA